MLFLVFLFFFFSFFQLCIFELLIVLLAVHSKDCPYPIPIANGRRRVNAAFSVYSCDRGYELKGKVIRHCAENGTWLTDEPTCISKLRCFCSKKIQKFSIQ